MKHAIWIIILLLIALARTVHSEDICNDACWEQIEKQNAKADEAEWAQSDAENAGLKALEAETIDNPFSKGENQ